MIESNDSQMFEDLSEAFTEYGMNDTYDELDDIVGELAINEKMFEAFIELVKACRTAKNQCCEDKVLRELVGDEVLTNTTLTRFYHCAACGTPFHKIYKLSSFDRVGD